MRKGRSKIYLRKIENAAKSQVTFCKRRSGLARKADEVSILCDVDIAFIAFSPTGRSVHLFSHNRFEDVLLRYINVPVNKRNYKIDNPEEKIKEVEHIVPGRHRIAFLKNRINHLREQLSNLRMDSEIIEAEASNFRPELKILSLNEASWREQYLEATLQIVKDQKLEMSRRSTMASLYNQTIITQTEPQPRGTNPNGLRQTSCGVFPSNAQEVSNEGLPTTWITESKPKCQTRPWLNGQSSQRLGKAPICNEIMQSNQHEQAMGMGLIDQNHTWVNTVPVFTNFNYPNKPMPAHPFMLPINQQMLIMGNNNYIPNQEQQMVPYGTSSMNNQNWQEGIQLPVVSPMTNFNQQERNWFPNVSSSSNGQNLNAPGLTANPPSAGPSILSVYDPRYGTPVDPFMRMLSENPSFATATSSIKKNNRIVASNHPITATTMATISNHQVATTSRNYSHPIAVTMINSHPITAAAASNFNYPITTTTTTTFNSQADVAASNDNHPITATTTFNNQAADNASNYNHLVTATINNNSNQNQQTAPPPPPPAQADERASSSNNLGEPEMLDEEIEEFINSLLVDLEDFEEEGS